jgi:hypothetical protein
MELLVAVDPGLVVRIGQGLIPLHERLEADHIRRPAFGGGLARGLLLEHHAQVVDLDDLLRIDLRHLQSTRRPLQKPLVLEPAERLPHRSAGDAEPLGDDHFAQGGARRVDPGEDLPPEDPEDRLAVNFR